VEDTAMDEEWSKRLTVPMVASAFAFAFVVGYFSAFDITWIPFFSLSEHLVLALRALPVAIVASVAFYFVLSYPDLLSGRRWLPFGIMFVWTVCLLLAAYMAFRYRHLGLFSTFVFIAAAAFLYYLIPLCAKSTTNALFWASNLWVLTLMIGFGSGSAWQVEKLLNVPRSGQDIELTDKSHVVGHLIAAGNTAVLLYDFGEKRVKLLERHDIKGIAEQRR
jgi:hypothetical protein